MPSKRNKGDRARKCHCVIERDISPSGRKTEYMRCFATKNVAKAAAKRIRKQYPGSYKVFVRSGYCRQSQVKKTARAAKRRK